MSKHKPTILLVNPPIYDFTAYDFWIKPYGLLRVGGRLKQTCHLFLWDYLDRHCPEINADAGHSDEFGRGKFQRQKVNKPVLFEDIPRHFYRFGKSRHTFVEYLKNNPPCDIALVATMMTYWYLAVQEVIEDIRHYWPKTAIILGGFYCSFMPQHASSLGADEIVIGDRLSESRYLSSLLSDDNLPCWELYPVLKTGVLTLTQGCPFRCGYCSVPLSETSFSIRPIERALEELRQLIDLGAQDIAFYDDALLFCAQEGLLPFLEHIDRWQLRARFHTPNGIHARFLTEKVAAMMVKAGFKTFYIGYESNAPTFHLPDGGKIAPDDLAQAANALKKFGVLKDAVVYEMLGHPRLDICQLQNSMQMAHQLGFRIMLSDFSPLPRTPDGESCRNLVDLSEPLNHNKTVFPIRFLGFQTVNYYKMLCRQFNAKLDF